MTTTDAFRTSTDRTAAMTPPEIEDTRATLAIMALGLAGEAGEVVDEVKKILGHGKPVDVAKLINELGDVLFYADRILAFLGATLDDAMAANAAKLAARYPAGFDQAERRHGFTAAEGA